MSSASHNSFVSSPKQHNQQTSLRYKENVAALFQKLNALQHTAENTKHQNHGRFMADFTQKEGKLLGGQKAKVDQFSAVLRSVANIER